MKNEALACINLTKFKGHSQIEMEGSAKNLLVLTALFIKELSEEMGEEPHDVLLVIHSCITRAQILEVLEGGRS
jgi:hypothetical protein